VRRARWRRRRGGWAAVGGVSHYWRAAFVAEDGWLATVGRDGVIRHLDGSTWTDASDTRARLLAVELVGDRGAVAVGAGGTVVRYDGERWRPLPAPADVRLTAAWAAPTGEVWVVGADAAWRWDGRAWTRTREGAVRAVWGASPRDVFVAHRDGRVERWDGASWTESRPAGGYGRMWLAGTGASDLFLVSDRFVAHFDGAAWTDLPNPDPVGGFVDPVALGGGRLVARDPAHYEYRVYVWDGTAWTTEPGLRHHRHFGAAPDGTRFAVRARNEMHRWDGSRWVEARHDDMRYLEDIAVRSADDAIAVGPEGQRWRWDGARWRDGRRGGSAHLRAVWGTGRDDVFAVGDDGTVLHFDGDAWTAQDSGVGAHLYAVHGRSPTDVWAAGADGTVIHYDGEAWRRQETGSRADLRDVRAIGARVFAVGSGGTVLRR